MFAIGVFIGVLAANVTKTSKKNKEEKSKICFVLTNFNNLKKAALLSTTKKEILIMLKKHLPKGYEVFPYLQVNNFAKADDDGFIPIFLTFAICNEELEVVAGILSDESWIKSKEFEQLEKRVFKDLEIPIIRYNRMPEEENLINDLRHMLKHS